MDSRLLMVAMLLCCAQGLQAAEVYRWVDANGGVHYADSPPPGQSAQEEELEFIRNTDPAAAAARLDEWDEEVRKRRAAEVEAQKIAAEEQQDEQARRSDCDNARRVIAGLESNPAARYKQADGSYERFSDDGREQRLAEARSREREYCGG